MMGQNSAILIVDDQLSAREVLRGLLQGQGYHLAFAKSGPEALAKAQELVPDLILLDVMMPEMTGFEVCQALRAHFVLAEVPIIMITALEDTDSRVKGIEAGADDFITKPFNAVELLARIRTTTRLNRYRRLLSARTSFEWVVKQADDGYLLVTRSDEILFANAQARLYLGLPPEESNSTAGNFLETARKQYRCEPEKVWAAWPDQPGSSEPATLYLVRPESAASRAFWLQVHALDLAAGPDEHRIIRLQDVTAQMTLRRTVWEFQSLIAHKLRTPLVSLTASLQLLEEERVRESMSPDQARLLDFVFRGTARLKRDVQEILQYMKTPALVQADSAFALSEIEPLIARISAALELDGVTFSAQNGLETGSLPLAEQAIEVILREILENAKKFHPQQLPAVEISTCRLNSGSQISLKIADDGLTLSPEQLALAWKPYYQGEKYFTGESPGMGLGLSKVALLVWEIGGSCRIRNREPGPGVVVELLLPVGQSNGVDNG